MKIIEIISEASKSAMMGYPPERVGEMLFKYKNNPLCFVHYHTIENVSINPRPRFIKDRPLIAIYAFRLISLKNSFSDPSKWRTYDEGFIAENSYASVLKYTGVGRWIEGKTYSPQDAKSDFDILTKKYKDIIDNKNPVIREYYKNLKWSSVYNLAFDIAFTLYQKTYKEKKLKTASDIVYHPQLDLKVKRNKIDISYLSKATNILSKDLNWGVIVDYSGKLSKWEPYQAVFLSPKSYKVLQTARINKENTAGNSPKTYLNKNYKDIDKLKWSIKYLQDIKNKTDEEILQNFATSLSTIPLDQIVNTKNEIVSMLRKNTEKLPALIKKYRKLGGREL